MDFLKTMWFAVVLMRGMCTCTAITRPHIRRTYRL